MTIPVSYDRVMVEWNDVGDDVDIILESAVPGYNSFADMVPHSTEIYYTIINTAEPSEWEVGKGVYDFSGDSLGRDVIISSSNSNAIVDFSSGTKYVFITFPAELANKIENITNAQITSGTIIFSCLADASVRANHMASGSVVSGAIASGQVGFGHLADGSVQSGTIGAAIITSVHMGSGAVLSGKIASGQIGTNHLAQTSIQAGHMSSGSVLSGSIASGQIGRNHLGANTIVSGHVASGAIVGQAGAGSFNIASGTIGTFDIGSGAIQSGRIASGQVGFGHLANGSVLSGTLGAAVITSVHIGSGGVLSGSIASGQIGNSHYSALSIFSGHIGSGAIVGRATGGGLSNIASGSIRGADLSSGAVISGQIGNGAVMSGSIGSGQVATYHMASGYVAHNLAASMSGSIYSLNTEENVSGHRCVNISQSGTARVAMASISGRQGVVGIAMDGALSGQPCNILTHGAFQSTSGLLNFSGFLGSQVYCSVSGHIAVMSGGFLSGGFTSGCAVTEIGYVTNSGGGLFCKGATYKLCSG